MKKLSILIIQITIILSLIFLSNCFQEKPTIYDGEYSIELIVKYDNQLLSYVHVEIIPLGYNLSPIKDTTDENGIVCFDHLVFTDYQVAIIEEIVTQSLNNELDFDTISVIGSKIIDAINIRSVIDTIHTIAAGTSSGIKINEIYYAGPVNNFGYQGDQFIELINTSNDTIYLDGMILGRLYRSLDNILMVFQFPGVPMGGTKDFPILPNEYKVIAQDAINHKKEIFNNASSLDLSFADFEMKNGMDFGDCDNLKVPNLDNIETGYRRDFIMNGSAGAIFISDGSDLNYLDGFEISSIIDFVEYKSSVINENICDKLDRGMGGRGLPIFSGKSVQRTYPGYDTNNSTLDFEILESPTPGY